MVLHLNTRQKCLHLKILNFTTLCVVSDFLSKIKKLLLADRAVHVRTAYSSFLGRYFLPLRYTIVCPLARRAEYTTVLRGLCLFSPYNWPIKGINIVLLLTAQQRSNTQCCSLVCLFFISLEAQSLESRETALAPASFTWQLRAVA